MTVIFSNWHFERQWFLDDRRLVLPGVDAVTDDGGLAQRLGGLKPVQALDQHEARSVRAHQDRRLLALLEHAVCDRIDALQVERFAPRGRHVDIGDREGLAFQHVGEGSTVARSVRAHTDKAIHHTLFVKYLIAFARERVSSAVIEFPYARAIDALFIYFQHSAQQKIGWHYLDGETDSLGRGFETAIARRAITLFAPAWEQLGRRAVIKIRHYYALGLNWFELYDL